MSSSLPFPARQDGDLHIVPEGVISDPREAVGQKERIFCSLT